MMISTGSVTRPKRSDFLSTSEACNLLGVSVGTVQRWVDIGVMPAWRTAGGHRLIPVHEVHRLARERKSQLARSCGRFKLGTRVKPLCLLTISSDSGIQEIANSCSSLDINTHYILASSVFEGLIAFGQLDPNIVILDMNLPEVDTVEMAISLRRIKLPGADFKLIAVVDEDALASTGANVLSDCATSVVSRRSLSSRLLKLGDE